MTTEVSTPIKTSKLIKDLTANARAHFDIFDKARNIYLAQIARAEADYNERLRRAITVLTGDDTAAASPPQPATPAANGQ